MDDLGFHDVGYARNARPDAESATPFLTQLAKTDGIRLNRHYAHWHCSPSRRSFLSGRLPVHCGGDNLTDFADDDLDVRMTWISEKMKQAGYNTSFFGKGHVGSRSVRMLPVHRGFDKHQGFLEGSKPYKSRDRWVDIGPSQDDEFSVSLWGESMFQSAREVLRDANKRAFMVMNPQVPHSPLERPPGRYNAPRSLSLLDQNMLAFDIEMSRTVGLFQEDPAVWNKTLVVFMSDNGGTTLKNYGNNWPFRGEKGTSFEGGFRATAFLAGGLIPAPLRGTSSELVMHIADWYRTFTNLAGVSGDDDPPEGPEFPGLRPGDVSDPQTPHVTVDGKLRNVWGDNSYPGVDSQDAMPALLNPGRFPKDALRPYLVLSNEVIIKRDAKLILAQPCSNGIEGTIPCKTEAHFGWAASDDWDDWTPPDDPELGCLAKIDIRDGIQAARFEPCLFNLGRDPREERPLARPRKLARLWRMLNQTLVYQYTPRLVGKEQGMSPPACLGECMEPEQAARGIFSVSRDTAVPHCGLENLDELGHNFCAANTS